MPLVLPYIEYHYWIINLVTSISTYSEERRRDALLNQLHQHRLLFFISREKNNFISSKIRAVILNETRGLILTVRFLLTSRRMRSA